MMAEQASNIIVVAKIGAPKGLKGFLALHSFLAEQKLLHSKARLYIQLASTRDKSWQPLEDFVLQGQGDRQQIQLNQIADRDEACQFTNALLGVERESLPHDQVEGEYYWTDLEGCEVINQQGEVFGIVDHLLETGANDVLVVKKDNQEILIPFVDQYVPHVDLSHKKIYVDWQWDYLE